MSLTRCRAKECTITVDGVIHKFRGDLDIEMELFDWFEIFKVGDRVVVTGNPIVFTMAIDGEVCRITELYDKYVGVVVLTDEESKKSNLTWYVPYENLTPFEVER